MTDNKKSTIAKMADLVSDEITYHIELQLFKSKLSKITLIAHSLGGLVFRAALPHLSQFKHYFSSFITLATPHMGYFHSDSKLLSVGMWLFNGVKDAPSLKEIRLMDSKNINESTIYKLSEEIGLEWFENIVLVGSHQD
jgi:triacylglycerol esterase/lipase EstA (alpha/beta hydrolase family)